MNTILKIAGGAVLGFLLAVVIDRTVESCHREFSGRKKFPGKKKVRNNRRWKTA